MKAVVLADFGSTFTKITVAEDKTGRLLATAQSPRYTEFEFLPKRERPIFEYMPAD